MPSSVWEGICLQKTERHCNKMFSFKNAIVWKFVIGSGITTNFKYFGNLHHRDSKLEARAV